MLSTPISLRIFFTRWAILRLITCNLVFSSLAEYSSSSFDLLRTCKTEALLGPGYLITLAKLNYYTLRFIALQLWLPLSPLVALNISIQQHKSSPLADGRNSPSHSFSHLLHQRKQPHMPLATLTPCITMPYTSSADGQLRSRSIRQPVALSQFQRRRARRPKKRAPSSPNTAGCVARRRMGIHLAASTRRAGPLTLLLTLSITPLPHHQLDDMPADVPGPLQDEVWHAAEFLAGLLLPKRALCHQKLAFAVDDLFFVEQSRVRRCGRHVGGSRIIIIIIIGIVIRTCAGVGSTSIACLAARSFHRPPSLLRLLRMMGVRIRRHRRRHHHRLRRLGWRRSTWHSCMKCQIHRLRLRETSVDISILSTGKSHSRSRRYDSKNRCCRSLLNKSAMFSVGAVKDDFPFKRARFDRFQGSPGLIHRLQLGLTKSTWTKHFPSLPSHQL
jgi:hypothetical protein